MLYLPANIGNVKVRDLTKLLVAFIANVFGKDRVGIGCLVDILLNVFQEGSTILATRIGKHHLFLYLARDVIPLRCRVFVIGGQRRPIELFLNHFDDTDPDRYSASHD